MAGDVVDVVGEQVLNVCQVLGRGALDRGALDRGALGHGFYLAGGTGLALQLGHRRSHDLDLFQRGPAERIPLQAIGRELERLFGREGLQPVQRQVDQATWTVAGVQVTFLAYPFPLLYDLVPGATIDPRLHGLSLASPGEIALMKAYALGRRATFRDYVDLYYLLKRGLTSLDEILDAAARKFVLADSPLFPARLFLEQLVYLGDVEDADTALRLVRERVARQDVESFLREQVAAYVRGQVRGEDEGR